MRLLRHRRYRRDEVQSAGADRRFTTDRVGVERVATVDDDVAGLHGVCELFDDSIGRGAGLDHDQDASRLLKCGNKLLDGLGAHEIALGTMLGDQGIGLRDAAVVQGNGVTVAGEIAGNIRTHDARPVTPI